MPIARGVPSAFAFLFVTSLAACGPKNLAQENDRLRAQVMDLNAEVEQLEHRTAELEASLAPQPALAPDTSSEIAANTPRVATIAVGRLSHIDEDEDQARAVLYLKPVDGRGRFVQMVGHVLVHAAVIPAEGDVRTVGRVEIAPQALRDAHRSGFMGTHYTVELPVQLDDGDSDVTARVEFRDGLTGRTIDAQQVIPRTRRTHR